MKHALASCLLFLFSESVFRRSIRQRWQKVFQNPCFIPYIKVALCIAQNKWYVQSGKLKYLYILYLSNFYFIQQICSMKMKINRFDLQEIKNGTDALSFDISYDVIIAADIVSLLSFVMLNVNLLK